MPFKVVFGLKNGKSVQKEFGDEFYAAVSGKKISDKMNGDSLGLEGYELEIKGGSDNAGFPMRRDVEGTARKRILAISGIGLTKIDKGVRQRKMVRGNTINENIAQINVKVLKEGKVPLIEEKPAEAAAATEAKP